MTASINTPLTLVSGVTLPNRLVKAAMTEGLANPRNQVTEAHLTLYRRWAEGGIGGMITGNVQIERNHLERAGNVVIDRTPSGDEMGRLSRWAEAGKSQGGVMIMQVSHAGRQTPKLINPRPAAPSPVALGLPGGQFGEPRAMTAEEIRAVVEGFGRAASVAQKAGFDGVQVHGAHGYLLSSFLSPLANQREDEYGGPLANRARLLVECVEEAKRAGGVGLSISVKLNSADFQKGGFSFEDCLAVIDILNGLEIDFVEISGGNYEQPRMMDLEGLQPVFEEEVRESTRKREAYFLNYAKGVQARSQLPLMVTGGFRTAAAMNSALAEGEADLIGIGRPLCVDTDVPAKLLSGELEEAKSWEKTLQLGPGIFGPNSPFKLIKTLNGFGAMGWFYEQLRLLGAGKSTDPDMGLLSAFLSNQRKEVATEKARKAAMS
ncbi:NADH:flavin oxidoreductase/NADH oxidase family protein [Hyphomonas pacifica]|nr:NADH:flavin oxidoreductase/NADH oxidase family protein [Hyphomonas pacifica]